MSEEEGKGIFGKLSTVVGQFLQGDLEYLGMIPQDAALEKAVRQQKPVSILYPEAKSAKSFEMIANRLLGMGEVPLPEKKGILQMLSRFVYRKN